MGGGGGGGRRDGCGTHAVTQANDSLFQKVSRSSSVVKLAVTCTKSLASCTLQFAVMVLLIG